MDEQAARPSLDRGADRAVPELQAGGLHRRFVGPDGGRQRLRGGVGLLVRLARQDALRAERLGPPGFGLSVLELGGVSLSRRHGLAQRRLVGPRVDREEQVPGPDVRPLVEMDGLDEAAHLRLDGDGRQRLDGPDGLHPHGHVLLGGDRGHHRHRRGTGGGGAAGAGGQEARGQEKRKSDAIPHGRLPSWCAALSKRCVAA